MENKMNDLVNREQVLEICRCFPIGTYRNEPVYDGSLSAAMDRISDLPAIIPELRWIPVTEKLPENDLPKGSTAKQIKVLVAYKRRNCSWVIRTQLRQKGRWYGQPNEWDWSVSDPISHWLPLPEPPNV